MTHFDREALDYFTVVRNQIAAVIREHKGASPGDMADEILDAIIDELNPPGYTPLTHFGPDQ